MEDLIEWLPTLAVMASGPVVLGVVMGVMRSMPSLPAVVRYAPLLLTGLAVVLFLAYGIRGMITAYGAVDAADAASKATLLAKGISEMMNCTAAAIVVSLSFSAGLIGTLIVTRRRRPERRPS